MHSRECVYDEAADKRRKVSAKHAHEELQYYRGFVAQLLQAIRRGNRTVVNNIVNTIRAGASDDDILSLCLKYDSDQEPAAPVPGDMVFADMGLDSMNDNILPNLNTWRN